MNLLEKIKILCKEQHVSQRKLEIDLGFSNGSISKWDNNSPSIDKVSKVANYFGVSINYLLGREREDSIRMNNLINIENKEGQLIVSSREIARNFEKQNKHVMEAIREIETSVENPAHLFIPNNYKDSYGREQSEYLLTRDGFTLLAMGFTGKKALNWKLRYIEAFNKMEKALKEVYHISETALVNNFMNSVEEKLFKSIDERFEKYEENYRPTHANKMDINNYIKNGLGEDRGPEEVNLVKQRVLLMLDAEAWQDIPYKKLIDNMRLIDESIRAVKSFRTKSQMSLFEE